MPPPSYTYAFETVKATIVGPNGAFALGSDASSSDEGITIEMAGPRNTTQPGADGAWMHSLHSYKGGRIIARFLKNSPTNALLSAMANADWSNPAAHGQNTIVVSNLLAGDVTTGQGCAFAIQPTVTYGKDGAGLEWSWDVGQIDQMLGAGVS